MRRYPTENIINCRDLGGWPTADGGVTVAGRAIRCGIPLDPTAVDLDWMRGMQVRTVLDLRGPDEVTSYPSFFATNPSFAYYNIPLYNANPASDEDNLPLAALYAQILAQYHANFARILRLLPTLPQPFLFHCFCGKDRTGLLSALLLAAAGVADTDIIADYQISFTYIKPFFEREIAAGSPLIWQTDLTRLHTPAQVMEKTLTLLRQQYGGVAGYFSAIGLSASEITAVRRLLR